jgi:hypothetical protein
VVQTAYSLHLFPLLLLKDPGAEHLLKTTKIIFVLCNGVFFLYHFLD